MRSCWGLAAGLAGVPAQRRHARGFFNQRVPYAHGGSQLKAPAGLLPGAPAPQSRGALSPLSGKAAVVLCPGTRFAACQPFTVTPRHAKALSPEAAH